MTNFFNKIRYYDYHIYKFFHSAISGRDWLNETYLFFSKYGIVFFFLSFIYLIMKKKVEAFFCAFLAMAIAFSLDFMITVFWQRPRPYISHENEILTPVLSGLRVDNASFPSAHTYVAFAIATSVFLYGHRRLGILLFLLALLIAIARIGAGLHYPSDVIGGMLLGIASGVIAYTVVHCYEKKWIEND
jgi:undecaprenyl-diphosphatase